MPDDKIYIITAEPDPTPETTNITGKREGDITHNPFDEKELPAIQIGNQRLKRVPIDAKLLKAQMSGMIATLEALFEEAEQKQGMQLSEVQLSVEINGSGEVSILGSGASLGNTGAIAMTFTRRHAPEP